MQLAFLAHDCPPVSGKRRHLCLLAQELAARGHRCRVYSGCAAGALPAAIDWRSLRARPAAFLEQVKADLAQAPVDALVGFDPYPGLDLYFAAAPALADTAVKGGLFKRLFGGRDEAEREQAVFAPEGDTHILLPTEARRDRFLELYNTPSARMHLLPPGVGPDRHLPDDASGLRKLLRADLELEAADFVLLFIADRFASGGLDQVIDALAFMHEDQPSIESRLLVVGQDDPRPYRRRAKRLKIEDSVQFLGGREDIPALMVAADLLLYPANSEETGTVLLEALTVGLPSVVSQACGHAHHVKAARAGILLPVPVVQEELQRAAMRYMDGIFRADCRESAQLYTRLADLGGLYREAADRVEQLLK